MDLGEHPLPILTKIYRRKKSIAANIELSKFSQTPDFFLIHSLQTVDGGGGGADEEADAAHRVA